MGVGSGGQAAVPPLIFIHGAYIADKGLIVLSFGVFLPLFGPFFRCTPPWMRLNSAIFWSFLLVFGLFFPLPPSSLEIFLPTFLGVC